MRPPTRPCITGPSPRSGMCVMFAPTARLTRTQARCVPEQLAHALRLDARADIDAATGGKRNDERDRPRRPILRGGVRAKRDNHCRGDHQPVHAHLPLAPTLARRTDGIKSVVVTAMLWARGRTGRTYVGFAALDVTGGAFVGRNKRSALRHCAACPLAGLLIVSP